MHRSDKILQIRMVQLPATAAIEYVAACCRTRKQELERELERERKLER